MLTQLQHQLFSLNTWLPATIAMAGDGKHLAVVMGKGNTQPLYGLAENGAQIRYYSINDHTRTPELVKTENIVGELLVNSAEWDADHVTLCYATMDVFNAYKLHRSNAFGQSKFTYTDVLPKPAMLARGANHRVYANALELSNLYLLENESLTASNIGIPGTVVNGTMPYQHQLIFDIEKEEQNLYARTLGNKLYEITDHLGNVRATISDKLVLNNGVYEADLTSASTYYPFGMSIGTLSNISDYRFGFNGKEKDNEIKGSGNSYNFGARIQDPRLGRWLSVDPYENKYPSLSSYNFVGNMPIIAIDPDGKKIVITGNTKFVSQVRKDLAYIATTKEGFSMIQKLEASSVEYKIRNVSIGFALSHGGKATAAYIKNPALLSSYDDEQEVLRYSPENSDFERENAKFTSAIALGHELRHMFQDLNDLISYDKNGKIKNLGKLEGSAVGFANYLRKSFGVSKLRTGYKDLDNFKLQNLKNEEIIDLNSIKMKTTTKPLINTSRFGDGIDNTQVNMFIGGESTTKVSFDSTPVGGNTKEEKSIEYSTPKKK